MNKKLLLGALLVCGMGATITSCVDDTESASVTALRNAKAEQMKAKADLDKANAEAAIITANATKTAQEALAAYYQAQAAAQEADAAYKNALTDQAKAAAEEAMARAQYEKQYYANLLQTLAGQLEIDLLNQKKDLLDAQTAYDKAIEDNNVEQRNKLNTLLSNYKNAQETLFEAQKVLAQNEIELAKLKAGIVTPTDALTFEIASLQQQNTELEKQNMEYQTYIDTWEQYTKGEAQDAIDQAYQDKLAAEASAKEASQANIDAKNASMVALNTLQTSDYVKAVLEIIPNGYYYPNIQTFGNDVQVFKVDENGYGPDEYGVPVVTSAPTEARGKYCAYVKEFGYDTNDNPVVVSETIIPLFSDIVSTTESIQYQLKYFNSWQPDGTAYIATESYNVYSAYYDLVSGSIDKFITAVTDNLTANTEYLNTAKENLENSTKAQKTAQEAYDKVVAAEDALNAAKKVVADAGDKVTEEQTKAVEKAQADFDKAITKADGTTTSVAELLSVLNEAKANTVQDQKVVNDAQSIVNADQALIASLNDKKNVLTDGAETNTTNMESANAAALASAEATVAYNQADNEKDQKTAEWSALSLIATDSNNADIKNQINNYKSNITANNNTISYNLGRIDDLQKQLNSTDLDNEKAISDLEQEITKNKEQIKVLQAQVDIAKAALDEAMGSDEGDSNTAE